MSTPTPSTRRFSWREQRVEDLLGRMTAAEKARMLAGSGWMESSPIERLGVPAIKMADGPMGVAQEVKAPGRDMILAPSRRWDTALERLRRFVED